MVLTRTQRSLFENVSCMTFVFPYLTLSLSCDKTLENFEFNLLDKGSVITPLHFIYALAYRIQVIDIGSKLGI